MDSGKQRNLMIIGIGVFLAVVIGVWYFTNQVKPTSTTFTLSYSPMDSTVLLDGQPVKAGKITVKNGSHTLSGKRQYFTDVTRTINTDNDIADSTIFLILSADTPEAQQYILDHPDEYKIREGASDTQVTKDNDQLIAKYPFVQYLPYETLDYDIEYHTNKDLTVELDVTLKPIANPADTGSYKDELEGYKKDALDYMTSNGIDPAKVKINWSPDPSKL